VSSSERRTCHLTLLPEGLEADVPYDSLLITACKKAGVKVPNLCGNRGLCTTCSAKVIEGLENLSPIEKTERRWLKWIGAPPNVRLTCQAHIRGNVTMRAAISPIRRLEYDPSDLPWTIEEPD
jgi:adenylate cyclase